ncbi:MAG: M16 family metallopeptidase [Akkermansiaceae bacterium]
MIFANIRFLATAGLILLSAQAHSLAKAGPDAGHPTPLIKWAQDESDISVDGNVTYGQLANGMRYVIMANEEPPGRVSMRLHIAAGSLMERDDQRGIAHFLEHMVFNGSKNFPDASKLIPQMQRLGISFGAHANAYTSFDETVYMLDLPNNEADTLKLGFDVMRDFADGALLEENEIEKERGVILSEKTTRDSVQRRLMEKQFNALLPDALLGKRFPIGTEEVIKTAPRSAFTDFYQDYYSPKNMTFVYVGDFDPEEAEQRVRSVFASMAAPHTLGSSPELGTIPNGHGFKTLALADKEVATTDLTLTTIRPYKYKPDTRDVRASKLPLKLAHMIIKRRFDILAKEENSPITSGGAYKYDLFKFAEIGGISIDARDHLWKEALPVLEQELRRAIEHGFTEAEFNEVKANLTKSYELAVKAAASRKTDELASSLTRHVHSQKVFSTPDDDLSILLASLATITPESCHLAFRDFWNTEDVTLILTTNTLQDQAQATLTKLYEESSRQEVKAPKTNAATSFAYTDIGEPGKIISQSELKDLEITQLAFENGCKCNLKHTDFEKNTISMTARVGSGKLTMPRDKPGLDLFCSSAFIPGGLGKHSADELKQILAGHNAGIYFQVAEDAFTLSGDTTPEDLELQLQLLCAYLTDPGLRPEGERMFEARLPDIYTQMKHTPAGAQMDIQAMLRGNDPRHVFPSRQQAEALGTEDMNSWLIPALENHYMEISLVGDLNMEQVIPILARTVGALPKRASSKPDNNSLRILSNLPKPPLSKDYTYESSVPMGRAAVAWKATGMSKENIGITRRLSILSSILSNRMREQIREELGEAYSPYAGFQASDTYHELGYLMAVSPGKPDQAEPIGNMIIEIANKLALEGASQDELTRALEPRLSELKKSLRQNSYWLGTVMEQCQAQPYRLDWARTRDEDYASITLKEINTLAGKYLVKENALRFAITSEDLK